MWNSAKLISLPVSHHKSLTISIAETVHDVHVGVFLICKYVRHVYYDRNVTQHTHTSLGSVQAETRSSYSSYNRLQ
jgi:hypothetical protein